MATKSNSALVDLLPATSRPAIPAASPARPAWRRVLALVTGAGDRALALYRRWDVYHERRMDLAAENDNVQLLFPRA